MLNEPKGNTAMARGEPGVVGAEKESRPSPIDVHVRSPIPLRPSRRATGFSESPDGFNDDALNRRETLELVRAYYRITDPAVRKRVFDLIKSMGPAEG